MRKLIWFLVPITCLANAEWVDVGQQLALNESHFNVVRSGAGPPAEKADVVDSGHGRLFKTRMDKADKVAEGIRRLVEARKVRLSTP